MKPVYSGLTPRLERCRHFADLSDTLSLTCL